MSTLSTHAPTRRPSIYLVPLVGQTPTGLDEIQADIDALLDARVVYTDEPLDAARAILVAVTGATVRPLRDLVGDAI